MRPFFPFVPSSPRPLIYTLSTKTLNSLHAITYRTGTERRHCTSCRPGSRSRFWILRVSRCTSLNEVRRQFYVARVRAAAVVVLAYDAPEEWPAAAAGFCDAMPLVHVENVVAVLGANAVRACSRRRTVVARRSTTNR